MLYTTEQNSSNPSLLERLTPREKLLAFAGLLTIGGLGFMSGVLLLGFSPNQALVETGILVPVLTIMGFFGTRVFNQIRKK